MTSAGISVHMVMQLCMPAVCVCLQDFRANIIVANTFNFCAQVLASKLDLALVNFVPEEPSDPLLTSVYPNSNRRAFIPNSLAYVPFAKTGILTQHMVSS